MGDAGPPIRGDDRPVDAFLRRVGTTFTLGESVGWQACPDASTNLTWKLRTTQGRYLVKQFRYPPSDDAWRRALDVAARFEWQAHSDHVVPMAAPCWSTAGRVIELMNDASGHAALVRVHAWVDGNPMPSTPPLTTVADAGAQLAAVQAFGARYPTQGTGSLRWWSWEPLRWLAALTARQMVDSVEAAEGRRALAGAEDLIQFAERSTSAWTMCHFDYKPANVIISTRGLVLVDWDQAAMCPPRCEAAEAALLWATTGGQIDQERVDTFMAGYLEAGGRLDVPTVADLGKWAASKTGWFDYTARRALGVLPCPCDEARSALSFARATLRELFHGLREADRWVKSMS